MIFFGNASRQLLESLQGVLGEPTQISEKLALVTKIMLRYHGNNKSADFYQDFSKHQKFYQVRAKLSIFLLFCLYTQNVAIK